MMTIDDNNDDENYIYDKITWMKTFYIHTIIMMMMIDDDMNLIFPL